jgi:hypothetical protein
VAAVQRAAPLQEEAKMIPVRRHTLNFSRRGLLLGATLVGAGLASSPAVADTKFSQQMAKYQKTPKGAARCDNCSQFQPPSACKVVTGPVAASGWCQLYATKT